MKPVLLIIAPTDFRDEELFETQEEIEKAGFKTVIASIQKGECLGVKGGTAYAELSIDDVNPKNYSAVAFVGGAGSRVYFDNPTAHSIAQSMFEANHPVAAICIGPVVLAKAGLLKEKHATIYPSETETIQSLGAIYTEEPVVKDGNIITGNGPVASREFGRTIVKAL